MTENMEWETPPEFFARLDKVYGFELDAAASPWNAKCKRYYTKANNGLLLPWARTTWLNPPYGRGIGDWLAKAQNEASKDNMTVCLLPARTDTAWWHNHVMVADVICFVRGRLHFRDRYGLIQHNPTFPSVVVIFGAIKHDESPRVCWMQAYL